MLKRVETHIRVMASPGQFHGITPTTVTLPATAGAPPRTYGPFTRVRDDAAAQGNQAFFDETLKSVAHSAAAGQSHTVLVCGPPASGRSQTVYNVTAPGIIQLMAEELLKQDLVVTWSAFSVRGAKAHDAFTGNAVAVQSLPSPMGPLPLASVKPLEKALVVAKFHTVTCSSPSPAVTYDASEAAFNYPCLLDVDSCWPRVSRSPRSGGTTAATARRPRCR